MIIKFMLIFLGSDNKRAFNKGKRETKQNKRKAARKQVKESGSGPLPDMGALCIWLVDLTNLLEFLVSSLLEALTPDYQVGQAPLIEVHWAPWYWGIPLSFLSKFQPLSTILHLELMILNHHFGTWSAQYRPVICCKNAKLYHLACSTVVFNISISLFCFRIEAFVTLLFSWFSWGYSVVKVSWGFPLQSETNQIFCSPSKSFTI